MAPAALPTLFCVPTDIFNYLSTAGAELRMDDDNLATGQTVTVTADAAVGATSLAVTPLRFPLMKGTNLNFEGGGMEAVVTVVLSATALVGAVSLSVVALDGAVNTSAIARDSGVNVAMAKRLVLACNYGTDWVRQYCFPRYDDDALATSFNVNRWASTYGGYWLARRCCRPCPETVKEDYEECLKEVQQVKSGHMAVPGIGTRTAAWPFFSNVSVDPAYWTHGNRVEQTVSEGTPTYYTQYVDYSDALLVWQS